MFHVGLAPLGGLLGPNIQFFQKYPFFAVFWLKMGVFYAGTGGRNDFFYKIRWLVHSILAREPKFHADWFRNGHATRKNPKNGP